MTLLGFLVNKTRRHARYVSERVLHKPNQSICLSLHISTVTFTLKSSTYIWIWASDLHFQLPARQKKWLVHTSFEKLHSFIYFFGDFFSPKASLVFLYLAFLVEISGDMLSSLCFWDFIWNRFSWSATFLRHPMTGSPGPTWKWVKECTIVLQSQDRWVLK